jgi:hypothetical protein
VLIPEVAPLLGKTGSFFGALTAESGRTVEAGFDAGVGFEATLPGSVLLLVVGGLC